MYIDPLLKPANAGARPAGRAAQASPYPPEIATHIAAGSSLLKALRLWRSRPLATLAARTGLSLDSLQALEAGTSPIVGTQRRALAKDLNIPEAWFDAPTGR